MIPSSLVLMLLLNPVNLDTAPPPHDLPQVDILAMNGEMIAFLDEHISETYPERRLRQLVNSIFSEEFLNLTYDNTQTKTALETFQSRNGNCLSFTTMFVAMARHLGLDARFQEVYIIPTWSRKGDTVVLSRHMNAVVFISGKQLEVDFNPYQDRKESSKRVVSDLRALAQYYNNIGCEIFSQGDPESAAPWMLQAVSLDPTLSFGWSNLGVNYRALNMLEKAEGAYLRALEINRHEYTAMVNLARLYRHQNRDREANRYLKRAENFRRQNPYYHYNLGETAYEAGNYKEAVTHYRRAIRRKKTEHEFHFSLAKAHFKLGQKEKAADSLKRAREFAPDVFNENRYYQKLDLLAYR